MRDGNISVAKFFSNKLKETQSVDGFFAIKKCKKNFLKGLLLVLASLSISANASPVSWYQWQGADGTYVSNACLAKLLPSLADVISCILSTSKPGVSYTGITRVNSASGYLNFRYSVVYPNGTVENRKAQVVYVQYGNQCPAGHVLNTEQGRCDGKPENNGPPQICANLAGTNPINVGSGNKFQIELDYQASSGSLVLQRIYNSDRTDKTHPWGNGWSGNYDRVLLPNVVSSNDIRVARPDGRIFNFNKTGGMWVANADIADQLIQQTDSSGSTIGWIYVVAADNSTETYSAAGQLLSIMSQSGRIQNLVYSDGISGKILDQNGNPTAATLPKGLLVGVSDSFGRTITFGYNQQGWVVKAVDSTGGTYLYSYDFGSSTFGNLLKVTYPDNRLRTYIYNESINTSGAYLPSALTGIVDENQNRFSTWKYDTLGRAISSEHNLPNNIPVKKFSISYTAGTDGNISAATVTDALNTTRNYSFTNILGVVKNTGVTQPCNSGCGTNSATTYDANGNIASKTDFNGNVTNYVYDLTRNLETSRTEAYGTPKARTITTQWHANYRLPTLITEPGKTTAFTYDANGNQLTKTITDTNVNKSRTWTYTYNSLGQVLTADGPRTDVNDVTTYTYYASASNTAGSVHSIGDLATVTNALNQVTSITNYDLNGRPLSITDSNGVVTTLTYAPRGWLKTKTINGTQPTGGASATTTYDYDGVGQLTKVTLPDNSYLTYTYDTAHRLTDIADSAGNNIHYTLDAMGNRLQEDTKDPSNALRKTRSRVFDSLNRLQKDIGGTSPSTQITQYTYDNNGNLKTITDPLNHVTTNGYDALNRLITVTDPANGVATTNYDALDQVTSVIDPRLVTTNYTINALGDVTLTQSPDSGNTQSIYDAAGNVTQKTDARGVVSNYTYDALNRLTSITYPANTAENVSFTYDSTANGNQGKGKLTGYSNDGGATVLTYDSYGNTIAQTDMIGTQIYVTAYEYDAANRVKQIIYPSGRIIVYTRNASGQITQVQWKANAASAPINLVSGVTYQPFGPLTAMTFGNGVVTTNQFDADYRLTHRTTSSTPAIDITYSYDAAGNITQLLDASNAYSKSYDYDVLNRLVSDNNETGTYLYQYDANGNRTFMQAGLFGEELDEPMPIQYQSQSNRMVSAFGSPITYDAAGNLTGYIGVLGYTYNQANRASTLNVNTGSQLMELGTYRYNALGRLTQNTEDRHYLYSLDGKYLAVNDFGGGVLFERTEYIYLDDMPIAQFKDSFNAGAVVDTVVTYIHTDHLNTPRALTDRVGNVVWRWEGDAFGIAPAMGGMDVDGNYSELALRFPGQISNGGDPFFYNMNRTYDSLLGRYTQSDPIGLDGGLNTYGYVNGNPVNDIDPLGLMGNASGASQGKTGESREPIDVSPCAYYQNRAQQTGCPYYKDTAPFMCANGGNVPLFWGVQTKELNCIRRCLVREDSKIANKQCSSCPSDQEINAYHEVCYSECGVSLSRYPGVNPLGVGPSSPFNPNRRKRL